MWLRLALSLAGMLLAAQAPAQPGPDDVPALCPPTESLLYAPGCPALGPGAYQAQAAAAGLRYPLPAVPITPTYAYRNLTPRAYAQVTEPGAPVYRHPLEALAGLPPARRFEKGFVYVSVLGQTVVNGTAFAQINPGEYMRADALAEARPSSFAGAAFESAPDAPVGWLIDSAPLSAAPGQPPAPDAPVAGRYQFFQVLGAQHVGEWNWYLIGPGQWVEQRHVALVQPRPPASAPADAIAVDTYEQTLGVYRGGRLRFATLISSGSRTFPTRPGTFKIWAKLTSGRMTGAYFEDRHDFYSLEDVPWILYYDGDRALHGAYWHDNFGAKSSHGCVNLSPRDARWLFDFAQVGDAVVIFTSAP